LPLSVTFHAFQTICGVLSTLIALIAIAPYYRAVLSGKTKPHQWSWFIFTVMNAIVTLSQFLEGGRASVCISFTFCLSSLGTFLLALKYGTRETSSLDRFLFAFSLLTIVVWLLTKNNAAAIWLTVVIDVCATAMTTLKIRNDPQSEDPKPWMIATTAFVFSCMSLVHTPVSVLYVRPIYGVLSDLVVIAAVFYWGRKKVVHEDIAPH
jgi:hypothetical protein